MRSFLSILSLSLCFGFALSASTALPAESEELRPAPKVDLSNIESINRRAVKQDKSPDTVHQWKADFATAQQYMELKEYGKAEEWAEAALTAIKKQPHTTDELIHCQLLLADAIYKQDRLEESLPLYLKALKTAQRSYGKNSMKLVPLHMTIGEVYEVEGSFKKSIKKHYQQALTITEQNEGATSLSTVSPRRSLAHVKALQEEDWGSPPAKRNTIAQQEVFEKDAEQMYFDCLSILLKQDKLPSSSLLEDVLADYTDLVLNSALPRKALVSSFQNELLKDRVSNLKQKQGTAASKWAAAVSARLGESSLAEINQGKTSSPPVDGTPIQTNRSYSDFAALEEINKQRVTFYERLIATDIDSLGAGHPSVARDLSGLASIYLSQKKYEDAKPLLKRALEIYQRIYKDDSAPVRQTALLLELLNESADKDRGKIDLSYVQNLPKIPLQAETIEVALRLNDLAFMLYCQGKIAPALSVYNWALAATIKATGDNSLMSASSMIDMSKVLRLNGKTAEAEVLENNARTIARNDIFEKRSQLLP